MPAPKRKPKTVKAIKASKPAIAIETRPTPEALKLEIRKLRKGLIEKDRRELKQDFYLFFQDAWRESLEPFVEFHPSPHYELLAEWAQLIGTGQFKKKFPDKKGLMVCVPPRTLKSVTFTVSLPAWAWTFAPWKRFLCLSYGQDLAEPLSQKRRNLILSRWYQKRWNVEICDDENEKRKYANQHGGYCFSSGTVATGWGANVVICDDMLNARYAYSKAKRQAVNKFWDDALTTRRNNPAEDVYLIVMQRLHANDLVGHLLAKERDEWVVLEIPMEAEQATEYVHPISGKVWRRPAGDILVPTMNTKRYIAGEKKNPKRWSAQFQQRPSPPGGFIFNPDKWRYFDPAAAPDPDFQVLSVDCAWKSGKENDKVALMVLGADGPRRFVLGYRHEHMSYVQILDAIRDTRKQFPKISFVLVEAAANGEAVLKQLGEEMPGMVGIVPKDDKEARAHAASADLESENCYIPDPEKDSKVQFDLVDNFAQFQGDGSVEFDDLIDAFTQGINWLRMRFWGSDHLDKDYEQLTKGKGDVHTGDACPGCGKKTVVREGSVWTCTSCHSEGRGGRVKLTKQGF